MIFCGSSSDVKYCAAHLMVERLKTEEQIDIAVSGGESGVPLNYVTIFN